MLATMRVPAVLSEQLEDGCALIDVREDEEWVAGHAPGAVHLPMSALPARIAEIPTTGDVVVLCRSGSRSAQVVAYLVQNGWSNVRNLADGMVGWALSGRPMVSEDGRDPEVW
jgi:rhodanese-related sulfurtransferase